MDGIMTERIDWHDYFLSQAILVSVRSPDTQTKVGAIFVNSDHRIVSTGFNGFVPGAPDSELPNTRPNKYPFMLHAEKNALLSCARQGKSTDGLIAYTFAEPCWNCLYDMVGAGIREVHFIHNPFLKMNGFSTTQEWNTQSYWLKNHISIHYYPIKILKLTKNILETLYSQVYNKPDQQ